MTECARSELDLTTVILNIDRGIFRKVLFNTLDGHAPRRIVGCSRQVDISGHALNI